MNLQEALHFELCDEVLEHTTTLVSLFVKGQAPHEVAPYLAGATLMNFGLMSKIVSGDAHGPGPREDATVSL